MNTKIHKTSIEDKARAKDSDIDMIVQCILPNYEDYDHDPDLGAVACELGDDLYHLDLRTIKTIAATLHALVAVAGRALNGELLEPNSSRRKKSQRKIRKPAARPFY